MNACLRAFACFVTSHQNLCGRAGVGTNSSFSFRIPWNGDFLREALPQAWRQSSVLQLFTTKVICSPLGLKTCLFNVHLLLDNEHGESGKHVCAVQPISPQPLSHWIQSTCRDPSTCTRPTDRPYHLPLSRQDLGPLLLRLHMWETLLQSH